MSACKNCGTPGPWDTCPYCAGDYVGAVNAGLIDPDPEPYDCHCEAEDRRAEAEDMAAEGRRL